MHTNNEPNASGDAATLHIEFSKEELSALNTAAERAGMKPEEFIRTVAIERSQAAPSHNVLQPPFSAGYAAAVAAGRPPTKGDLVDSWESMLNVGRCELIPLNAQQSRHVMAFAAFAGKPPREFVDEFFNTEQLFTSIGFEEALIAWAQRPDEARPPWGRADDKPSRQAFYSSVRTLDALCVLQHHAPPPANSAWQ